MVSFRAKGEERERRRKGARVHLLSTLRRRSFFREQSPQMTLPQDRQWCLRLVSVKLAEHSIHDATWCESKHRVAAPAMSGDGPTQCKRCEGGERGGNDNSTSSSGIQTGASVRANASFLLVARVARFICHALIAFLRALIHSCTTLSASLDECA
jgi:hypothetical protein